MAKAKQFRKPKKRPSRERQDALADEKRDADLNELLEVLTESRKATSWHVPWRSGINVVELCLVINRTLEPNETELLNVVEWLRRFVEGRVHDQDAYWETQKFVEGLSLHAHYANEKFLLVAARSAQLVICNSHGGGHVYNTLLEAIWRYAPSDADRTVRSLRCKDALGINWNFDGSPNDRRRRAFYTAWDRGLYEVAYAVRA